MRRTRNLPRAVALAALIAASAPAPASRAQTPDPAPRAQMPAPASPAEPSPAEPAPDGRNAPVSLVADSVSVDADAGTVTASGNVEVLQGDRLLRAERIVYSDTENRIRAEGPLVLTDPAFGVIAAETAELDADLTEGLIASARLLLAGELQLAAGEIRRAGDRYTVLHHSIASTCEVCAGGGPPIWAVRAERIVRDEVTQQIFLRNARFEVFGLPVLWLPYFRMSDPGADRVSGVLTPSLRQSDIYGTGIKVPYYHVLGPSADVTLTPFVTTRGGTLLEGEYRRRFRRGGIDLFGVILPNDKLEDRSLRGTLSVEGFHDIGRGFRGTLDTTVVSDDSFLQQFDYPDDDRLTSTLQIARTRAEDDFRLSAVAFQSLRPEEDSSEVPLILPELSYRRIWQDALFGGRVGVDADALGLLREDGRDVMRVGGGSDWRRDWTIGPGLLTTISTGAELDLYHLREGDGSGNRNEFRTVPWIRAELRWPLARTTGTAVHVLEPVADIAWSDTLGADQLPNEDSLLPEFDETNLFALDRYPGRDRVETGLRAGLGLSWSVFDDRGRSLQTTVGRVVRFSDEDQFADGSGLEGTLSDWVGAVEVGIGAGLGAINRIRFDDAFDISRNEFGLVYDTEELGLAASWVYLDEEALSPELGPQPQTSEFAFGARYRFLPNWEVAGNARYDAAEDAMIRAGAGITWGNECAEVDITLSRRFVTSRNVEPSTSIRFEVRLAGLGADSTDWPRRTCRG